MRNTRIFNMFTMTMIIAILAGITSSTELFAQSPTKLSRVLPLVRPDGTTVGENPGEVLPKGTVKLEIKGNMQSFAVDAKNMDTSYPDGLAVYIGDSPQITNGTPRYVSVMNQSGTNGHWQVEFTSNNNSAPPQLGVASLIDLVGSTVFVVSGGSNTILRAVVLPLFPNPSKLSYQERAQLDLPPTPLSLKAKGSIRVKYNGKTGASLLEVKVKKLNSGNSYVAGSPAAVTDTNACADAIVTSNGTVVWRHDTGKGDELPGGTEEGITTIMDLSGMPVLVNDCFGGTHLQGSIPYPPYATPE